MRTDEPRLRWRQGVYHRLMKRTNWSVALSVAILLSACTRGSTLVDRAHCTPAGVPNESIAKPHHCVDGLKSWLDQHPGAEIISVAAPSDVRVENGNTSRSSTAGTTQLVVVYRSAGK
jgi:hypothetical protein